MNSQQKAEALLQELKRKIELENELKSVNKNIGSQSVELNETMTEEGVEKINIQGVDFKPHIEQNFTLKEDVPYKKWDEFPEWFKWLRDQGEGGLIKVKETVPANTRNKFLRDWTGERRPLPDFVEEKFFNTVKYSKTAISKMVEREGAEDVNA